MYRVTRPANGPNRRGGAPRPLCSSHAHTHTHDIPVYIIIIPTIYTTIQVSLAKLHAPPRKTTLYIPLAGLQTPPI